MVPFNNYLWDKVGYNFSKEICSKINKNEWLGFDLAYDAIAVQYVSHYVTRSPLINSGR